uniref:FAS1 domain-containing protein n=1 Tax=Kalanchoe fedtschenkoi TaxID=63787 RepID=A0A7N0ZRP4_KALFE
MASKLATLLFIASLLLILSTQTLAQTPTAPAPASSGLPNVTGILDKAGQYTKLILLLEKTQLATQLENQLNTSSEGLTLLAPTDNAFNNLPSGTVNSLSNQEQVELILYHVLPKYYALVDFSTVSNPVRTQGQDGLNFTSQSNQLNVSSGLVTTQINNPLRQQFPLAVYQVDQVLLPLSLFGAKPPASPPPPPPASDKTADAPTNASSDKNDSSGSGRMNAGMGLVVGLVVLCARAFLS